MLIMNKIVFAVLSISSILFSSQLVEDIINGNLEIDENLNVIDEFLLKNKGSTDALLLQALITKDGTIASELFENYYNQSGSNKYDEICIKRLGDYYYAKGSYFAASSWFKIIPENFPKSKYLESSIRYHLNSLLISGNFSEADRLEKEYRSKYSQFNFNSTYNSNHDEKKADLDNEVVYSVLVGNFKKYRDALDYKKNLSKEGFLCRIENIKIDNLDYYSLKIGYYKDKKTALNSMKRLKSRLGINDAVIIKN